MRAVIQKVKKASLYIDGQVYSHIDKGFVILLAVAEDDSQDDLDYMLKKALGLRVFEDDQGKMNLSPKDVGANIMVVSQFTLYGDVRKGFRPSFTESAKGDKALSYYEEFINQAKKDFPNLQTGVFGADMQVELINDGPVTIQLDSRKIY